MSVLVKGMKMPTSCLRGGCPIEGGSCSLWEDEYWKSPDERYRKRHPKCPLIPVSPHGRLIDADALKEWIEAWFTMHRGYHPYSKSNLIPSTEIVDILDRLPTIIEAEEGEEA